MHKIEFHTPAQKSLLPFHDILFTTLAWTPWWSEAVTRTPTFVHNNHSHWSVLPQSATTITLRFRYHKLCKQPLHQAFGHTLLLTLRLRKLNTTLVWQGGRRWIEREVPNAALYLQYFSLQRSGGRVDMLSPSLLVYEARRTMI
jgi:hypothetical protein